MPRCHQKFFAGRIFILALLLLAAAPALRAQSLNLEGQTGGYIIPAAYTIPSDAGHKFSSPTLGFHYLKAGTTVGDFYISSVEEGYGNWLEFGYSRNNHSNGRDFNTANSSGTSGASDLWAYNGFNVYNAKGRVMKEDWKGHKWIPAVALGFVLRQGDQYVTGALQNTTGTTSHPHPSTTNGDMYAVATKLVRQTKIPLLLDFGVRGTNAQLYGAGGQAGSTPVSAPLAAGAPCPPDCTYTNSSAWAVKPFGGMGIPIPISKSNRAIVIEPGAEVAPEPRYTQNLPQAHVATTEVYGFRFTQLPSFRWTLDAGVGHIGNNLGPGFYIHANTVESVALSYRFGHDQAPAPAKK
jgi:hypothetical protein